MRAVVLRGGQLCCEERAEPVPGPGQVLARSLCCGICGSDLHALRAARSSQPSHSATMVLGHEFCAEVLDVGPATPKRFRSGARVVSVPVAMGNDGYETIGYSAQFSGGFGERMILTESMLVEVPNGLSDADAAMTEPFSVGEHAVAESAANASSVNLVIGCGPVGLAVIAALAQRGFGPILAADPSPTRRALAVRMGAHTVIDSTREDAHSHWAGQGLSAEFRGRSVLADLDTGGRRAVIFECVGKPGMIDNIMAGAPLGSQIMVVGSCLDPDSIHPIVGIMKRLELRFVLGYTRDEFRRTLLNISEGRLEAGALVTGLVSLEAVPEAFEQLEDPEAHCKILVRP